MGALPSTPQLPNVSVADIKASLPASAQASFQSYVNDYNAPEAQKVGSVALQALAHGSISNADIVHAYSGAVALVPGVGWIMAGLTEFIYANGRQISDAINSAFNALGVTGCRPQNKSLAQWQSDAQIPKPKPGTLASVMLPMLLQAWSDWATCNPMAHGLNYMAWQTQLVPAIVALWNKNTPGPSIEYFIPALYGSAVLLCPNQGNMLCTPSQGPYFFQPLSEVPASARWGVEGMNWFSVKANAGPLALPPVRHVMLNMHLGPSAPKKIPLHLGPTKAPVLSTGAKVGAAAGAAGLAWWLLFSKSATAIHWGAPLRRLLRA